MVLQLQFMDFGRKLSPVIVPVRAFFLLQWVALLDLTLSASLLADALQLALSSLTLLLAPLGHMLCY